MEGLSIATLVEIISGAMILIYGLYQAFIKIFGNIGYFKKKKEEKLKKEKEQRKKEYKEFFEHGAEEIVGEILEKIDSINSEQNIRLDTLVNSTNDILRKEITKIYYKYVPYKKIPRYVKEEVFILYKDYKSQDGNSFIDEIFDEIKVWDVVTTEEEVFQESN